MTRLIRNLCALCATVLLCFSLTPAVGGAQPTKAGKVTGVAVYELTKQFLTAAPKRYNGSPGHAAAEHFIKSHFAPEDKDHRLEVDHFTASTPAGLQSMNNIIVKFRLGPGRTGSLCWLRTMRPTIR
jgi:glutaminyl-peptide cyclotransferase